MTRVLFICAKNKLRSKRVICLGIPDDYDYMAPGLVVLLQKRAGRFLPTP